mmetsp:Transcript_79017/g.149055  ORF Transcript_79017/g.149055 Transcript_79017/m.149055 type:complete len:199 (+) Transcript_79017:78-674(+)
MSDSTTTNQCEDSEYQHLRIFKTNSLDSGRILLGSYDHCKPFYPPNHHSIGLIVNLCKRTGEPRREVKHDVAVLYEVLSESSLEWELLECLDRVFPAMKDVLSQGKDVLVHCNEGRVRSPTVVALYLTVVAGQSYEAAGVSVVMRFAQQLTLPAKLRELQATFGTIQEETGQSAQAGNLFTVSEEAGDSGEIDADPNR